MYNFLNVVNADQLYYYCYYYYYYTVNTSVLKVDKTHFQECALDMLSEMFGEDCVGKLVKSDRVSLTVNDTEATLNLTTCVSREFWFLASILN